MADTKPEPQSVRSTSGTRADSELRKSSSLHHVLDTPGTPSQEPNETLSRNHSPTSKPSIYVHESSSKEQGDEEKSVQSDSYTRQADANVNPSHTMTVVHSRRNANGTIGSVYSGNKIRHLKKEDGLPLWRKDIQYSFLRFVFEDKTAVFTMDTDGTDGHTFADIYINAMARSSKTSKVLREKLLSDRESAVNMAMICLLVNVGRMNTTLNFFPEMRAQLRTYHSIPCLQVHQDANSQYKGLQDAPRLKSILKGSCEDSEQPNTIEKIEKADIPRTNPVNLIFVMSQYAPKVSDMHFHPPRDFFDLVVRCTLSSESRAKAFLWLIWWYLESDFSREAAENNPFGPGQPPEDDPDGMPVKVPTFKRLTEDQASAENVDTEEEKAYGAKMRLQRKSILEDDETVGPPLKKPAGPPKSTIEKGVPSPGRSDLDRTRSPSPSEVPPLNMPKPRKLAASHREGTSTPRPETDKASLPSRLVLKASKNDRNVDSSSPIHSAAPNSVTPHTRRARPETSHQRAVNMNRRMRIDNILYKSMVTDQNKVLKRRKKNTSTKTYLAMSRIYDLPDDYDTEDEGGWGPGGLVPDPRHEEEDYGGEATRVKKVIERAIRRVGREEGGEGGGKSLTDGIFGTSKSKRKAEKAGLCIGGSEGPRGRKRHAQNDVENQGEVLDDLDLELLGEGGAGQDEGESGDSEDGDSDDVGEATEDEVEGVGY